MWRLINALGIRYVGEATAQLLAQHFQNLEDLMEATKEDLLHVEGVGEQVASSIREFFANDRNQALIAKTAGGRGQGVAAGTSGRLPPGRQDLRVHRRARRLIPGRSQDHGHGPGRQGDFVGLRQDRLRGGGGRPGSKLAKARELGVTILDEAGFGELLKRSA